MPKSTLNQGRFTEATEAHAGKRRLREDLAEQPIFHIMPQIDQEHLRDGLRKAYLAEY